MSLLHPHHHFVPFEEEPDPVGDRRELKAEIGRLRRELADVHAENDKLQHAMDHMAAEFATRKRGRRR